MKNRLVIGTSLILALTGSSLWTLPVHAEEKTKQSATNQDLPSGLLQLPISSNFYSPYAFVVNKKDRLLTVWEQTANGLKQVAQFPADLGKNAGAKLKRNDHKTPIGIYFLLERLDANQLDTNTYGQRAFTTDYPNFFDRSEGKTGSGIWLHAVPDNVPLTRGSRGCVVVRNEAILGLTQYVKPPRTPILIQDESEMVSATEHAKRTEELNKWLEGWRASWEAKNIDQYIENYSTEFRSMRMNKEQWRKYKTRLAGLYKSIHIHLSKPSIFVHREYAVVRFLQQYASDMHTDVGEKVLYLKRQPDGYRIVGEVWAEESSQMALQEIESNPTTVTTSSALVCTGAECGAKTIAQ